MSQTSLNKDFVDVVSKITDIGKAWHSEDLLVNAQYNQPYCQKSFKDLPPLPLEKQQSAIIVSAGPSLHKFGVLQKIKESNYQGAIIAIDGSLIKCLKNGIVPDYVLTLDPHPSRVVRWFGDYEFEKNAENDDYFTRQDLDIEFRNNSIIENQANIDLINQYGPQMKLIICSSVAKNVTQRALDANFETFWWNPIVDAPSSADSLTRKIYNVNQMSCMNTGGTVGTAAWVFANAVLNIPDIALTGMDLGYHFDTPIELTQTYYELQEFIQDEEDFKNLFPEFTFPLTGENYYTDPTYFWYRKNFLQLLSQAKGLTTNCTEAGTLFDDSLPCTTLQQFLDKVK